MMSVRVGYYYSLVLILLLWVPTVLLCEHGGAIKGGVVDQTTGRPLVGANVELLGTFLGASTDPEGWFRIENVPEGFYDIRVSMIGYEPRTIPKVAVGPETKSLSDIALTPALIAFNPVVVTAEKRAQSLQDSPHSVSVLPSSEIRSRNSLRLDDALEMVPGVYFMKEDINIRGSTGYRQNSANRVLVTVDGAPVLSSDIGSISWDVLPIFEVDRIEVVKGAGSALWGSYAIGGVVNIITKDPSPRGALYYRLTGGIYDDPSVKEWIWAPERTLGFHRIDLGFSKAFGNLGVRLHTSRYFSTGDRQDGDFEKWNVSGKASYRFNDTSKLTFYFSWIRDESAFFLQWRSPFIPDTAEVSPPQLFHPLLPDEQGNELKQNWLHSYLSYSQILSQNSNFKLRVSYLRSVVANQFGAAGDFLPTNGFEGESQLDWLQSPSHTVTLGSEFKVAFVEGAFFGGSHIEYAIAPFLQYEWQVLSPLKLIAGARFDRHELVDGPVNHQLNPKFGFTFQPVGGLSIRGSSGRGFRVPSIAERTITFDSGNFVVVANPNLLPESAWSHEIGLRTHSHNGWFFDLAFFENRYENFIEALPDLAQTETEIVVGFQNVPSARIRGFEVGAAMTFWRNRLRLRASVTHLDSRNLELKQPLSYRPRWIALINSSIRIGPVELRADYRYASRLQRVEIYSLDQRVPQHELNLRSRLNFSNFSLVLGVNNALNYNYVQVERNLGEIRNFFMSVQGKL